MKRLTALTDEQVALMATVRDEWIAHGLCCEPADREMAERGVRLAYEAAGLPAPRAIVWLGSPMSAAIAAVCWPTWFGDQVFGQVSGQVRAQVHGQVHDQVSGQVHGQVHDQVHGQVHGQVFDQVSDQVFGQVSGQVFGQVFDQVSGQVHGQVDAGRWSKYVAGNLWAGYYAWIDYFRRIGIRNLDAIEGQSLVAKSAGWWYPMRDACIVSERPVDRIYGEQIAPPGWGSHRLHRDDGPAVLWPDGWATYAWHGTRVPAELIETDWTVERIAQEENTEIRRCAIEKFGWGEYLDALNVRPVDECDDPANRPHRLALYDLPDAMQVYGERVRMLVMQNASLDRDGRRRTFAETVPASVQSALSAAAWQFGTDEKTYKQLVRAT